MEVDLEFSVVWEADPVPKARARTNKNGHTWTPDHVTAAEQALGWLYRQALPAGHSDDGSSKWSIEINVCTATLRGSDIDNYLKLAMDAANKIVFVDDRQVVEGRVTINRKDPHPRTEVTFRRFA